MFHNIELWFCLWETKGLSTGAGPGFSNCGGGGGGAKDYMHALYIEIQYLETYTESLMQSQSWKITTTGCQTNQSKVYQPV